MSVLLLPPYNPIHPSPLPHVVNPKPPQLKNKPPPKDEPARRCGACIFNYTGTHCLLVKQRNAKWGVPKGSVENCEDDLSCMYREVLEETNFDLRQYQHMIIYPITWKQYTIFLIYLPHDISWDMLPQDSREIEKIKWVHISDLRQYTLNYITKYTLYRKKAKDKIPALIQRRINSPAWLKPHYRYGNITKNPGHAVSRGHATHNHTWRPLERSPTDPKFPIQSDGSPNGKRVVGDDVHTTVTTTGNATGNAAVTTTVTTASTPTSVQSTGKQQFNRYYFQRRLKNLGGSPSSINRGSKHSASASSANPPFARNVLSGFSGPVCKRKNYFHWTRRHSSGFAFPSKAHRKIKPTRYTKPYIIPQKRRGRPGHYHAGPT